MGTQQEYIVLLNEDGSAAGQAPKLASHHAHTPLHLAFSCYVFDPQGNFLLTQRAHSKKVWPDVFTNSVCGHPAPSEGIEAAIMRRLQYELGITDVEQLQVVLPDYRYKTPPYNGIIENEVCPVYVCVTSQKPRPNPDEVETYEWLSWKSLQQRIASHPEDFSYWFKDQLPRLEKQPIFRKLSRQ